MLKVAPRLYQESIFANAVKSNTLVVLPTGLGKTLVALMMALYYMPRGKVLIMAPTKPLVEQHLKSFLRDSDIDDCDCALITGAVKREERTYEQRVIFATPQTIRNDVLTRKFNLSEFSLIIFDECHKAVGDYAYVFIASEFKGRVLGLSASPGSDSDKIKEVCINLGITKIETRTENDPDVKPYLNKKEVNNIELELPDELKQVLEFLKRALSACYKELKDEGVIKNYNSNQLIKRDLLALQRNALQNRSYLAMSLIAKAIKAVHAFELLQTQGLESLRNYFEELKKQSSKASKGLLRDPYFQRAMQLAFSTEAEHPKFKALLDLIKPDKTHLVFTQYRTTAELITKMLGGCARLFVGQRGSNGMSQKEQLRILESFRNNEFNTLVSTSISEEGLDIPSIDSAIFFEPVPSALRTVQRRGRVGRAKMGEVYILITKGTIDEKYKWVAHYKEKLMKDAINNININDLQPTLNKFF